MPYYISTKFRKSQLFFSRTEQFFSASVFRMEQARFFRARRFAPPCEKAVYLPRQTRTEKVFPHLGQREVCLPFTRRRRSFALQKGQAR